MWYSAVTQTNNDLRHMTPLHSNYAVPNLISRYRNHDEDTQHFKFMDEVQRLVEKYTGSNHSSSVIELK